MNYIGSKHSLLDFLEKEIMKFINGVEPKCQIFFDVFAGTGTVGRHFKEREFRVVANDIQYYAYCLSYAYVKINKNPKFTNVAKDLDSPSKQNFKDSIDLVLDYLNNLNGEKGFVFENYCPGGTAGSAFKRQYFSDENGKRCDAVRMRIEVWREEGKLTEDEYFYLLASLIDAVDKVANTASVYGAFLKHIKKSAMKPLHLERPAIVRSDEDHEVYNENGQQLVERLFCDVLYMDPPYNQRQYCANYHVLETIARYDDPDLKGVTGLRPYDGQKSDFCMKKRALSACEDMVKKTSARYVFLSYNSEGIMAKDEILQMIGQYGEVDVVIRDYQRFRADTDRENRVYKADRVEEYLFCLKKR